MKIDLNVKYMSLVDDSMDSTSLVTIKDLKISVTEWIVQLPPSC